MPELRARFSPALTVLMPLKAYHDRYLEQSLASLVGQTCETWRLVVIVEPADAEGLGEVLRPWLGDDRLSIAVNEGVRLAGAINTGVRHAVTDFVALLLADDLWAPDAVEVLSDHIRRFPAADFFHSARRIIDDEGIAISSVHGARVDVTLDDFAQGAPVKHLLCWRRDYALALGGLDERSRSVGPDDLDFPWTMAEHGARFTAIDACLYIYRDHRRIERLTTHLPLAVHVGELRRIFRKHGLRRRDTNKRISEAKQTYLKQCLYRSALDRRGDVSLSRRASPWRDTYQ